MKKKPDKMARLIRQELRRRKMSMNRLAIESGTCYASVHGFVTGDRDPALSVVERWCRVLDLDLKRKDR